MVAASAVLAASAAVVVVGWVADGGATVGQVVGVCIPAAVGIALLGLLAVGRRPLTNRVAAAVVGVAAVVLVVVPVAPLVISAPFGSQLASTWSPTVVRVAAAALLGSGVGLVLALAMPFLGGEPGAGGRRRVRRPPLAARKAAARAPEGPPARFAVAAPGPPDCGLVAGRDEPDGPDELDEIARRAAGGDRVAIEQFVRRTQADVWRLCRYLVDAQAADDLTAEVYEHALRSLPSYEGRAPARAWLLTITRRRCADEFRRRGRARRAHDRLGPSPTEVGARDGEVAVHDALARLDGERRAAFVLTQLLGLSYQEAADVIGCPIGTVRSRVARARADLLSAIGPGVDEAGPERGWGTRRAEQR